MCECTKQFIYEIILENKLVAKISYKYKKKVFKNIYSLKIFGILLFL